MSVRPTWMSEFKLMRILTTGKGPVSECTVQEDSGGTCCLSIAANSSIRRWSGPCGTMVKAYLRYEQAEAFGIISSKSNVLFDASGKHLISGALEDTAFWSVRQGTQIVTLSPELASSSTSTRAAAEVTKIALSPNSSQLAAGYSDGSVRLWDIAGRTCLVTLSGHSGAVTALQFSSNGALLASGSADTTLIMWDVVGEAGLCRFRGHKDAVTDLALIHQGNKLISASKDGCVKVWDVVLQHCSQTLIGFKGEVWSLAVSPDETRLVAGCVDADIRLYVIRSADKNETPTAAAAAAAAAGSPRSEAEHAHPEIQAVVDATNAAAGRLRPGSHHDLLMFMGTVRRAGQERVSMIRYDSSGVYLGVMGAGQGLEIFRVRSEDEALRKMKRRKKRRKEKQQHKVAKTADAAAPQQQQQQQQDSEDEEPDLAGTGSAEFTVQASDEVGSMLFVKSKHKLKSFCFNPAGGPKGYLGQVALGLSNNSIEVVIFKEGGYDTTTKFDMSGHRSDVRCLALSSDDKQLLSGSNSGCKLWDPLTGACLGSIDSGYALCCVFAPGNRHALVGSKEGLIQLIDVGACTAIHSEQAHSSPVWSLALLPDKSGFVSGSADKTIKFWTWTVTESHPQGVHDTAADNSIHNNANGHSDAAAASGPGRPHVARQLGFTETRLLEMSDDVLCVRVSPDGRLLAASLLDATIKVYYVDSLKFFLSLYGHKLPALTLDISSDSALLVTGSADKNIKVWGLDFGDCHKSLFAHQDTITAVAFVRDTHYAFSVSKDRMLKYWDLDRFEMLLELPGHHSEVWALAVSAYGDFCMTGSHDRSIRRWERTSEPFFVEEEKERRLESLFEADMEQQHRATKSAAGQMMLGPEGGTFGTGAADTEEGSVSAAGRRTIESVSAADTITDALDVAAHEQEKDQEYQVAVAAANQSGGASGGTNKAAAAKPKRPLSNPLMLGLSPEAYVLRSVSSVRANDLEQALLLLPFRDALRLLQWVAGWLAQGSQVELSCRAATLLLRLHHAQLTSTPSARQTLVDLHQRMRAAVQGQKDTLGFNIAALKYLQRAAKETAGVDDADIVQAARAVLLAAEITAV